MSRFCIRPTFNILQQRTKSKLIAILSSPSSSSLSTDSTGQPLKRTPLYDFHVKHGGKMVPFAGYEMPVLYTGDLSIKDSHLHTRAKASLFDVSHMLQMEISGIDRVKFFESLVVADVNGLKENEGSLTLYTTKSGGIIDDLIVTKKPDTLYVVSNASRSKEDLEHLHLNRKDYYIKNIDADVSFTMLSDCSLLALQGPEAATALQQLLDFDLKTLKFMNGIETKLDNIPSRVTRCGYTGEDGFELRIPNDGVEQIAQKLLDSSVTSVKLAGLGARDSLRLEAGLCLYGNDIDTETTPIEAGLAWTVAKSRRPLANFPGAEIILKQLKDKPKRRRVGFVAVSNGPPIRTGSKIYSKPEMSDETLVGTVTSGCPSPSINCNVGMGYVRSGFAKNGTKLFCEVRGKLYEYQITKMPFVPTHYYL